MKKKKSKSIGLKYLYVKGDINLIQSSKKFLVFDYLP